MKKYLLLFVVLFFVSCGGGINLNRVKGITGEYAPKIVADGVEFSINVPDATYVTIAGNFNGWNPRVTELSKNDSGIWSIKLTLKLGKKYYYKYVVDGYQLADPDNPNTVSDGYGGVNSVVEVPKK